MKKFKGFIILALSMVLMLNCIIVAADTGALQVRPAGNRNVISYNAIQPTTLDPQKAYSSSAIDIISNMMEGLMRRSGNSIIPGVATHYEISKDGLIYTFYLRDAVWSDGKPITANDFAYGWQRALDPATNADYAYILYYIKNGEKFNKGEVKQEQLGIKVIDQKTLQVTLENPTPYFIDLTTYVTYFPARKDIVELYKEKYFTDSTYIVSNGPFKLNSWIDNFNIQLEKNTSYWNAGNVKIDVINARIFKSTEDSIKAYLAGQIDVYDYYQYQANEIAINETVSLYDGVVSYIQFNNSDKAGILNNANIRKALTLSINRQEYINKSGTLNEVPALSLVAPELIPGKAKSFREEAGNLLKDNEVVAAQEALKLGMKELKLSKMPVLNFTTVGTTNALKQAGILAKMWKEKLGIDVNISGISYSDLYSNMNKGDYQIAYAAWAPDYFDALTYLEMFDSSVNNNDFWYKNGDFNNLIKSIKKETDKLKRIDLLKSAEKKIIDSYVISPLSFRIGKIAIKPYVKNLQISTVGATFDFTFAEIAEGCKTFKTTDDKFTVNANKYWLDTNVDSLKEKGTVLALSDLSGDAALLAQRIDTIYNEIDLELYMELYFKQMKNVYANGTLSEEVHIVVDGIPMVQQQFNFLDGQVNTTGVFTFFVMDNDIYIIMALTTADKYEQRKTELEQMVKSIKLVR